MLKNANFKFILLSFSKIFVFIILYSINLYADIKPDLQTFFERRHSFCKQNVSMTCIKNCDLDPTGKIHELDVFLSCKKYFDDNHCSEVKDLTPQSERHLIMSCDPKEICRDEIPNNILTCTIKGVLTQFQIPNLFLMGIGVGATALGANALVAAIPMVPFVVLGGSNTAEICDKDLNYKKMLIKVHNLSLLQTENNLDIESKNKDILKMPCTDLKRFLDIRLETFVQKRQDTLRLSLDSQKMEIPPASKAMLESLKSNRCFNSTRVKENLCQTISGFMAGVVVGGVAQSLTKKTMLLASVEKPTSKLRVYTEAEKEKILSDLKKASEIKRDSVQHAVNIVNGKATVSIQYLDSGQIQFMGALSAAIKAGLVDHINAGKVVGPKVLSLLLRWQAQAPTQNPLKITGSLTPANLVDEMNAQASFFKNPVLNDGAREPKFWTPQEIKKFNNAVDDLKIKEACQSFYASALNDCGKLYFEIKGTQPIQVDYSIP